MSKIKKIIVFIIFISVIVLFTNTVKAASDFDLEKLNFDVQLNENGSMDVVETWEVKINDETNTLFKTFEIDKTKYGEITNVYVTDVTANKEFEQINTWMNHVSTDCYQALVHSGEFEIAWGINKSSGRKTYKIEYTVTDVVKKYSDCAELYWQFVGSKFGTPAETVTGTITIPANVEKKENLRVWAHGPLNGEINATSTNTVKFEITPFIANTFIEVRVAVLEPEIFFEITKTNNKNELEEIIKEETEWAEEANRQREWQKNEEKIISGVCIAIGVIIGVFFVYRIYKNIQKIKETPKLEPTMKLDYFREIPDEEATPGDAAFIYYFNKTQMRMVMPKILSATMLDLSLKKYIEFEVDSEKPKKEQVTVKMTEKQNKEELKETEKVAYELLSKIAGGNRCFTMKELEKYAQKHNTSFLSKLEEIETAAKEEEELQKNYDSEIRKIHDKWQTKGSIIFIAFAIVFMFLIGLISVGYSFIGLLAATIPAIVDAMLCFNIAGRYSGLTQKGIDEKEKWEGLKKFMDDFSMMNEKEVPELILWEKYLVYATLFGNADKVLKQLKVRYPEFSNDEYLRNTTYFYLLSHTDFNNSFVNSVSSSMQKAYESSVAASSASSGGGYGGGFSGGGGGGRRPVVAEADVKP